MAVGSNKLSGKIIVFLMKLRSKLMSGNCYLLSYSMREVQSSSYFKRSLPKLSHFNAQGLLLQLLAHISNPQRHTAD